MQVNVRGGTNAGWRKVKMALKRDWRCPSCKASVKYYWTQCPKCGHPRDQ
jgi:rubredoxin